MRIVGSLARLSLRIPLILLVVSYPVPYRIFASEASAIGFDKWYPASMYGFRMTDDQGIHGPFVRGTCYSSSFCSSDAPITDTFALFPVGAAALSMTSIGQLIPNTYVLKMPADLANSCAADIRSVNDCKSVTGSYSLIVTHSDFNLLDQTDPIWSQGDALSTENPTRISVNFTSMTVDDAGVRTITTEIDTWFVYRFWFTMSFEITPSIALVCASGPCSEIITWPSFISALNSMVSTVNSVSHSTSPTRISLRISVPASAIQSNLDWYAISGVWTAGNGPERTSNCSNRGAQCSIAETQPHTALGIWKDPQLSQGALPLLSDFKDLSNYTAQQLSRIVPSSTVSDVYTTIHITDFGVGYSLSENCTIMNINACVTSTGYEKLTVSILFDVIGSRSTFLTEYQPPTPNPAAGGSVKGRLVDASSGPLNLSPAGATVRATDLTCCQAATDSNGHFRINDLPEGPHRFSAEAPGFYPIEFTATLKVGQITDLGEIRMQPTNPWYKFEWCLWDTSLPVIGPSRFCAPMVLVLAGIGLLSMLLLIPTMTIFKTRIPGLLRKPS